MALNFPPVDANDGNPTDGMIWTSPNGYQWKYNAGIPGWESVAPTGNSNIVYRGGIDLTRDPDNQFNDLQPGNEFVVTTGDDPVNDGFYPGLGGFNVPEGSMVRYDGSEWQVLNQIPYATENAPGVVELAAADQVEDPNNHRTVLTPKRGHELVDYKIVQATTDIVGKTRYATKNEAIAGTETQAALTPSSIEDLIARIDRLEYNIVDTAMVMWFAGGTESIPNGWMHCDGSRIYNEGITAGLYVALQAVGNPWGNGPASDVVRVPDLRGRFIRGYDDGAGRDPDDAAFGASQEDTFMSHTHSVNDLGHKHDIQGNSYDVTITYPDSDILIDDNLGVVRQNETANAFSNISIRNTGQQETRPKNLNLTPVIKL